MSIISYPRLKFELKEVIANYNIPIALVRYDDYSDDSWAHYGVILHYRGYRIMGRFDEDHPYSLPKFQISPAPDSCHYYSNHLCYCRPEEWHPNFTLTLAIAEVMRFLDDYDHGRVS